MGCAVLRLRPHSLITLNRFAILPEPPESFNRRHWKILIVVCQLAMGLSVTVPISVTEHGHCGEIAP